MATVRRTPRAQADLEEILRDLEQKSQRAAERFAIRLDEKCEALGQFPELGRVRDEILPGIRSTLVGKHVLFHRIRGDSVELLRIVHGRRDLPRILRDDP